MKTLLRIILAVAVALATYMTVVAQVNPQNNQPDDAAVKKPNKEKKP